MIAGPTPGLTLGIDLGSTRIKCAAFRQPDGLAEPDAVSAPPLSGTGLVREADPEAWLRAIQGLLADRAPPGTPLGLACQRSSFVLWERESGRAVTPLVCWQDRRAQGWCARQAGLEPLLIRRSGLKLSPHYAGPKLATLLEADTSLARRMAAGDLLFGTLDTWLIWRLSDRRVHATDLGMAARTAMLDLQTGCWDPDLLEAYGVPAHVLPRVMPSWGRADRLANGLVLTASLADQAAGALGAMDLDGRTVLANFGTGAFVLWPGVSAAVRLPGYLTAPLGGVAGESIHALEGTINGAGPTLDACAPGPTGLPSVDPAPAAFGLPDRAGVGAPHWLPGLGPLLSAPARGLSGGERRRVMLEGLLFRVREILDDLGRGSRPQRILLAGGLTADPALAQGLAALLGRPVDLLVEPQSGLLAVARLAAGLPPRAAAARRRVMPGNGGAYLVDKYPRWRRWLRAALDQESGAMDSPQ